MRVLMLPTLKHFRSEESGIVRVIEAYTRYLPHYGIELVDENMSYDLKVAHAGTSDNAEIAALHGIYFTSDYQADAWEWAVNEKVVDSIRQAKEITVPSEWVAEIIRRDTRRLPHVIGHGIEWDDWQHNEQSQGHVLWNKNRIGDVCDPKPLMDRLIGSRTYTLLVRLRLVGNPRT